MGTRLSTSFTAKPPYPWYKPYPWSYKAIHGTKPYPWYMDMALNHGYSALQRFCNIQSAEFQLKTPKPYTWYSQLAYRYQMESFSPTLLLLLSNYMYPCNLRQQVYTWELYQKPLLYPEEYIWPRLTSANQVSLKSGVVGSGLIKVRCSWIRSH